MSTDFFPCSYPSLKYMTVHHEVGTNFIMYAITAMIIFDGRENRFYELQHGFRFKIRNTLRFQTVLF